MIARQTAGEDYLRTDLTFPPSVIERAAEAIGNASYSGRISYHNSATVALLAAFAEMERIGMAKHGSLLINEGGTWIADVVGDGKVLDGEFPALIIRTTPQETGT